MTLENIKKILEKEEFLCSLSTGTEELPFDHLLVHLGMDGKGREKVLEVVGMLQQIPSEFSLAQSNNAPSRIQFRSLLPFIVTDEALTNVSSLLHFLNQSMDLPGFELNELEGKIYYRYVWITSASQVDPSSLLSVMGAILLNIRLFSETIETVATGQKTFNELLSEVVQIGKPSSQKDI